MGAFIYEKKCKEANLDSFFFFAMKLKTFFKQYNFYVTACKEEEDFFVVVVVVIKYNSCNYTKKFFLFAFL